MIKLNLFLNFSYNALVLLFFKGNISLEKSKRKKPYGWLPDQSWEDCIRLSQDFSKTFGSLIDEIERDENQWKKVIN